jgi:DNA primase
MGQDEAVREIKERLDIVELVGDVVPLRKVGKNFRGLCPFHSEKTPSFYVSPDRQTFHCYGCGRGGDLFSFVMEKEGLTFTEALEILAERAGVPLVRKTGNRRSLSEIMELALAFYRENLQGASGEPARRYLEGRGLPVSAWSRFELGWAPPAWDSLWAWLRNRGVSRQEAISCGLIVEGQKGDYDRFRGRVIFPIRDMAGKLTAFGGRILSGEGAKYINSPEGPLFNKRSLLYLLPAAKGSIREKGETIVVEGYMDALRLHLCGFQNSVATLGTSLTADQAALLKRMSDRVLICYDSDAAGQEATLRGMSLLQNEGLEVRVVELPRGKDPDELLASEGGDALFGQALAKAMPLPLYHVHARRELLAGPGRKKAIEEILNGLAELTMLDLAPHLGAIAGTLGIFSHQLSELLSERQREKKNSAIPEKRDSALSSVLIEKRQGNRAEDLPDSLESALFFLLWNSPEKRAASAPEAVLPLFGDERIQGAAAALLNGEPPESLRRIWYETGNRFLESALAAGGDFCEAFPDREEAWQKIEAGLRKRNAEKEYRILREKMTRGLATSEEMSRLNRLARLLKGRR